MQPFINTSDTVRHTVIRQVQTITHTILSSHSHLSLIQYMII